jgi:hypothetical protein
VPEKICKIMPATHLGKCLKIFAKIPENPENI